MALLDNNMDGFSGSIDKTIVVRQLSGERTVISKYPDMSKVIPSAEQKKQRSKFAEAQAAAKEFLADPVNKAHYKSRCKPGQRAHGLYISEWMAARKEIKPEVKNTGLIIVSCDLGKYKEFLRN